MIDFIKKLSRFNKFHIKNVLTLGFNKKEIKKINKL